MHCVRCGTCCCAGIADLSLIAIKSGLMPRQAISHHVSQDEQCLPAMCCARFFSADAPACLLKEVNALETPHSWQRPQPHLVLRVLQDLRDGLALHQRVQHEVRARQLPRPAAAPKLPDPRLLVCGPGSAMSSIHHGCECLTPFADPRRRRVC